MSPEEIMSAKKQIPGYVYDAFNECIAEAIRGGTGYFTQWALRSAILRRVPSCLAPCYRLDTNDLPMEALAAARDYEGHGWNVTFDTTNSRFTFTPRRG